MQTITLTGYTPAELQDQFPSGYQRAYQRWSARQDEIPWMDETIDSLKKLLYAADIKLRDWSLGAYNRGNHIKIEFPREEIEEFTHRRAWAWLESHLFGPLRIRNAMLIDDWRKHIDPATGFLKRNAHLQKRTRYYYTGDKHHRRGAGGEIPSCPLTGYCADDDYLDALRKSVRSGDDLKTAFQSLADTCMELLEQEAEHASSEEVFLETSDLFFDEDGHDLSTHF